MAFDKGISTAEYVLFCTHKRVNQKKDGGTRVFRRFKALGGAFKGRRCRFAQQMLLEKSADFQLKSKNNFFERNGDNCGLPMRLLRLYKDRSPCRLLPQLVQSETAAI